MRRRLLWFLSCLIAVSGALPRCENFFRSRKYGYLFSIILPKTTQTTIDMRLEFRFRYELKSDAHLPEIIYIGKSTTSGIWEDIDEGKTINLKIKLNNHPRNNPKVGRVFLGKKIICADPPEANFKEYKIAQLNLPERQNKTTEAPVTTTQATTTTEAPIIRENCGNLTPDEAEAHSTGNVNETWPWLATMHVRQLYECPATFISRTRAVAAAHCLQEELNVDDVSLHIFSGRDIQVLYYKIHPKYRIGAQSYDIAILETNRVDDAGFVPVCLNYDESTLPRVRGKLFSYVYQPKTFKFEPKMEDLPVVQNKYCRNATRHNFCVNQGDDNGWICNYNSGGSFLTNEDQRWYLRGIVSTVSRGLNTDCANEFISLTKVDKFYETLKGEVANKVFN